MKDKIIKEIVNNTKKLISFKTIKNNYIEFNNAHTYIKKFLNNYIIKEIIVDNYNNLVISNTKDKKLDIIFCVHLDVVPSKTYKAIEKDGKLYGRGSFDMKSQIAVIMSLFKNNNTSKKIALIITSDEEIGGNCCKQILKHYNSQLAVVPDAGKNFELVIEEKGLLQLELSISGTSYHASEPFKGDNAILKLMDIYYKLLKIYKMPKNEKEYLTTINLSKINGGNSNNMVADFATMTLDIRYTKKDTINSIITNIKSISKNINIKILDQGPVFTVNKNLPILKKFIKNTEKVLNKKLKITKCTATSDAIYFSEKNIPTILINPIGNYWHNPNEYVDINSLYTLYEIFKTLF